MNLRHREEIFAGALSMTQGTLWKGSLHFGRITIPVKLHAAIKEERIEFHLLHKHDRVRLRQQMICALEGSAVPPQEQAKGFEVEENRYIIVDPADLEADAPESDRTIYVHEFVGAKEIAPTFIDRPYYLEPEDAPKRYCALVAALREMDVGGICTWSMRKRSYLGALRAGGNVLRLHVLRHADEVLAATSPEPAQSVVSEKELKVAGELISHLTAPFEPSKFRDEHQVKLRAMIEKKARGEKIAVLPPRRLRPTPSAGLLKALEASLKKVA